MTNLTKNQHFVPRLLLKNFAQGENGAVQIYDSSRDVLRSPTNIRRVFAENYFYDDDNAIEHYLAQHIEGPVAQFIDAIVSSPKSLISRGNTELLGFIGAQLHRTPKALNTARDFIDKHLQLLQMDIEELNDFPTGSIPRNMLEMDNDRRLLAEGIVNGVRLFPLLEDLSWHVLSNSTDLPFVISDHPVIQYDWYLRNSSDFSYTSLTNFGVQIFLPLSPKVTLALIDKSIYKFGEKGSCHTELSDVSDIELLNSLQFRSRQSFVVFPEKMNPNYVRERCKSLSANSLFKNHAWSSEPVDIGGEELRSTQVVWRKQFIFSSWLSISKIKRKITKKALMCWDRKPEVVAGHKAFVLHSRTNNTP